MDIALIILGALLLVSGLLGCIIPGIPGPPLAYISLLLLQATSDHPFSTKFLILWAIITIVITILDYVVPVWGTKKFGGTRSGVLGSTIGLVAGLFVLPPIGLIIGPFLGAVIGEIIAGQKTKQAFKAGFGSFLGFLAGTIMKLAITLLMGFFFLYNLF